MASETLEDKKPDEDLPTEEKAVAPEGDEEKGTTETVEKDVSEEEEKVKEVEEEEQEVVEEEKKTDGDGEPSEKPKASRKRSSKKGGRVGESKKPGEESTQKQPRKRNSISKEPVTPVDRPARERKSVERYSALSSEKVPATKVLSIEKGRGTQLKDIPNVAFKLSKRKPDENLQMLHTILFGKKAKVHYLKRNISQFSGYVWLQNEEKQRAKVKEKIDKFIKEKLLDFCDVLDIPVYKATTKKEELSAKLLEFLESPHATTEVSLADKEEKSKKRKRKVTAGTNVTSGKASRHGSNKKRKQSPEITNKEKHISKVEEKVEDEDETGSADVRGDPDEGDDSDRVQKEESSDEGESESENAEDKTNDHMESVKGSAKSIKGSEAKAKTKTKATPVKLGTPTKSIKTPAKSIKGSSTSALKKGAAADDRVSASPTKLKASAIKKGSDDDKRRAKHTSTSVKEQSTRKKQPSKSGAKASVKEQGAGKASKKAKAEPSREEMHSVVTNIMKEVDFNTATLSDIIRQLGTHFGMDLMHRKAEVKGIIEEVINNMTDEDDGEDDENSEQAEGEADDKAEEDNDD